MAFFELVLIVGVVVAIVYYARKKGLAPGVFGGSANKTPPKGNA